MIALLKGSLRPAKVGALHNGGDGRNEIPLSSPRYVVVPPRQVSSADGESVNGHRRNILYLKYMPSRGLSVSSWISTSCQPHNLSKTSLEGTLKGGQHRGRKRKYWTDNVKEETSLLMPELLTRASAEKTRTRISAVSSLMSPRRPNRSRDRGTKVN